MDAKSLGKRILQIREKRGLKQEKVEQALGLPKKAITRIESGERLVSTLELAKLAELFNIPIRDFFLEQEAEEDFLVALHRAASGLEKSSKIQNEVDRCILICREGRFLEELLNISVKQKTISYGSGLPKSTIEAIKQGEMAAKAERRRLGIGIMPIYDISEIISSEGIWCSAILLPVEMSGLFLHHPSIGRAILINVNHVRSRQRFSFAHEYAHALFDSDRSILVSETINASDLIEKRANAFAAAFLLPEEGIAEMMRFLNKGLPSRTSFAVFDLATEGVVDAEERLFAAEQKISPQDVALIARRFGVSYQATVYRLQSLHYVSPKQRENLLEEEMNGKRYLNMLALSDDDERGEKKSLLQRGVIVYISHLVIESYRQEKISRGRVVELCKLLGLPALKILEIAQNANPDNDL